MARHKNGNWTLNDPVKAWGEVTAALLMDIRDELQELNRTLRCSRVQRMADAMIRLDKRAQVAGHLLQRRKT